MSNEVFYFLAKLFFQEYQIKLGLYKAYYKGQFFLQLKISKPDQIFRLFIFLVPAGTFLERNWENIFSILQAFIFISKKLYLTVYS